LGQQVHLECQAHEDKMGNQVVQDFQANLEDQDSLVSLVTKEIVDHLVAVDQWEDQEKVVCLAQMDSLVSQAAEAHLEVLVPLDLMEMLDLQVCKDQLVQLVA